MIEISKIRVGDYIEFRSPTWTTQQKATRKVTGFMGNYPVVKYQATNFLVKPEEILKIIRMR